MTGISIVLCCYNSVTRLEVTLRALSQLEIPVGVPVELLFVDNNSTDGTPERAVEWWEEYGSPYRITVLKEEKQGLGFARFCGINVAQYDLFLFVDDDNELAPDYLLEGYACLKSHPDIGILGGLSHGIFQSPLPSWINPGFPFKSLLSSIAVSTPERSQAGYLDGYQEFIYGAGAFLSRKVVSPYLNHGYDLMLKGRVGNRLLSGEDEEFCCWARLLGLRLYRSDKLHFKHHITSGRLQKSYFERLYFGFGYSSVVLDMYHGVLQGHVLPPQKVSIERRARLKIIMLSIANAIIGGFLSDKMFKARLLIQFQQGITQYLRDRPQVEEVHAKILQLGKSLHD